MPSDAAAAAQDGDTVSIAPGNYFDCAVWRASNLTIAGAGPGVALTDRACGGKAAFVIQGHDVTVRGLSFLRIRVPDGNGAGIRAEGRDLTVLDSGFTNNQVAILAGGSGTLRIADCRFTANGVSLDGRATHAVLAGDLDVLRIERSTFEAARGGDHVASAARLTELVGNHLADEGGHMSGPMVAVHDGALTLAGNGFTLAAAAADRAGVVLATGDAPAIVVRGNTLDAQSSVPLLRNWTGTAAQASDNRVPPGVAVVSDDGAAYHRLRARVAALRDEGRGLARYARHMVAQMARGLSLIP